MPKDNANIRATNRDRNIRMSTASSGTMLSASVSVRPAGSDDVCIKPGCTHPLDKYNKLHLCTGAKISSEHYMCRLCLGQKTNKMEMVHSGAQKFQVYQYSASKCPVCKDTEGCDTSARRKLVPVRQKDGSWEVPKKTEEEGKEEGEGGEAVGGGDAVENGEKGDEDGKD